MTNLPNLVRTFIRPELMLLAVFAVLLLSPESALANQTEELTKIIKTNTEFVEGWEFVRSLINWVMVGGLLVIAFANVLRINIDTYAVKKILPTLLAGFALANFSLFFAELFLQLSSSLSLTSQQFGGLWGDGATGIPLLQLVYDVLEDLKSMASALSTASSVTGAAILAVVISATPAGRIIAIVLLILMAALPFLLAIALAAIFTVRFYMLQLLIVVAPLAFIGMAFPFTRNYFQTWLKTFFLWIFMEPVAHAVAAVGILFLKMDIFAGGYETLLQYFVGISAMIAAIIVPFRMGGWVMDGVAKLGKMAFGASRLGIAGYAEKTGGKGVTGALAKHATTALYAPDVIQNLRKEREARVRAGAIGKTAHELEQGEGRLGRFGRIWQPRTEGLSTIAESTVESQIHEIAKTDGINEASAAEVMDYVIQARKEGNHLRAIAGMDAVYNKIGRSNFVGEARTRLKKLQERLESDPNDLKAREDVRDLLMTIGAVGKDVKTAELFDEDGKLKDSDKIDKRIIDVKDGKASLVEHGQTYSLISLKAMGAQMTNDGKGDGFDNEHDLLQQMRIRRRLRYDKRAKDQLFFDESFTMVRDEKGHYHVASKAQIAEAGGAAYGDIDPQKNMNSKNVSAAIKDDHLDDTEMYAMLNGNFSTNNVKHFDRLTSETMAGLERILKSKRGLQRNFEYLDEVAKMFEKNLKANNPKMTDEKIKAIVEERKKAARVYIESYHTLINEDHTKAADLARKGIAKLNAEKLSRDEGIDPDLVGDDDFTVS